jgi:lipopolysaccharide transport system permease protein
MAHLLADVSEMLAEQYEYRDLLMQMTLRDLLLRYKQTVMGFGWAVFMPLVNTIVFSVIFMRVAPINVGMPYPLFAYSGLLAWNFSASSLRFAVNSLTSNVNLVTKVYFPREILPISTVLVALVDFAVGAVVLAGMMIYYRVGLSWSMLALPLVVLVHVIFTLAVAFVLSMANLFYRDVKYLFEILLTGWMFVTSVLYPMELVGGRTGLLLRLNPMTPIIDGYRDVLLRGQLPTNLSFLIAAALSAVFVMIAWVGFHRAEFQFAENV